MQNLSDYLQNEFASFLKDHDTNTLSDAISELLLSYIETKSKFGLDLVVQENLDGIRGLIKILDEANKLK